MSRARTEIQDCLSSMILFIRAYKTFEMGQLLQICHVLDEQSSLYEQKILSRMLFQFITHVIEQCKKSHSDYEFLSIMICQSLIYNLYRRNSKNGMNNSIYSNSIMISSSSQIGIGVHDQSTHSIRHYESIQDHYITNFVNFVQDFIFQQQLRKKIKQMIERTNRKIPENSLNQSQRYTDILLQTIEYILNKDSKNDKISEFQYIKDQLGSKSTGISTHFEKKNIKILINQVNKIIFSNKINRIVFLLEDVKQNVYVSLLRIYISFIYGDDRDREGVREKGDAKSLKYFNGVSYTGDEMIINLIWTYIESIPNKNEIFQTPKNPLFKLIQSYLYCFFLPTFRKFNQIVSKCCKYDFSDAFQFYRVCQATINKDLCEFIEQLPGDLLDFLGQIYKISLHLQLRLTKKQASQTVSTASTTVLSRVKKLLVYSLLVKPTLIEIYYSQGNDLEKYEEVCNYLINLLFKSSLKKYQQGQGQGSQQLNDKDSELVTVLTKCISKKIDDKIVGGIWDDGDFGYLERGGADLSMYVLEEPVLNYDYEVLWDVIKSIEFTPKDLKQFQMHKKSQLSDKILSGNINENQNNLNHNYGMNLGFNQSTFSPMHRGKKDSLDFNESIQYLESGGGIDQNQGNYQREQIDFLTWMTVGGSRDYGEKASRNRAASTEKLKELSKITISKKKIKEVQRLYQAYKDIIR